MSYRISQSFVALGGLLGHSGRRRGSTKKRVVFADKNHAQTRIKTGRDARFCGHWRTLHPNADYDENQ
jgi:hypothetical protein